MFAPAFQIAALAPTHLCSHAQRALEFNA